MSPTPLGLFLRPENKLRVRVENPRDLYRNLDDHPLQGSLARWFGVRYFRPKGDPRQKVLDRLSCKISRLSLRKL